MTKLQAQKTQTFLREPKKLAFVFVLKVYDGKEKKSTSNDKGNN